LVIVIVLPSATAGAWSALAFACSTVARAAFATAFAAFTRATFPLAVSALAALAEILGPFRGINDAVTVLVAADGRRNAFVLAGAARALAARRGVFCGYAQGREAKRQGCDNEDLLHT
jgi:hypothetical protein